MKKLHLRLGMRTVKTVAAVVLSMFVVDAVGTTDSRLIFAMLGATAAMQPTFRESLDSCIAQVVGVLFGAVAGLFLRHLPAPVLFNTGLGIALCIVLYNALGIRFSPSMPIFMVVLLCTTPDIQAIPYAIGRIWDSAIGLGIGMLINTLVFPYDNSRQIRSLVRSIESESLLFLERMFAGSGSRPDAEVMRSQITGMAQQLSIFSSQLLFHRRREQQAQLASFRRCEEMARQMLAQMEVLRHISKPGCLSAENRRRLIECGVRIGDTPEGSCDDLETSLVTNYHVEEILRLRRALLDALG